MMNIKDTEKEIKRKCNPILKRYGKFISYNPYPYGEPGTPDKIGCINGEMILIEFKREGKKPTALQIQRHKEWRDVGAQVWVIHSVEELKEKIEDEIVKEVWENFVEKVKEKIKGVIE